MNDMFQEDSKHGGLFSTILKKISEIERFIRDHKSVQHGGGGGSVLGDVVGPAGATDGYHAVFDGASGKLLKQGPIYTDDVNIGVATVVVANARISAVAAAGKWAIYGQSTDNYAVYGNSLNHAGIAGDSNTYIGVLGWSGSGTAILGQSQTGVGVAGYATQNSAGVFCMYGVLSGNNSANTVKIRRYPSGVYDVTGNVLQITDDPTVSGTISGALISGQIDATERIRFDPRVVDGATAVGTFVDTRNALSTADAKLWSLRNAGTEKFYVAWDGTVNIPTGTTYNINGSPHTHDYGSIVFPVNGVLSVATNVPNAFVFPNAATISEWYVYLKTTGSAGSSIFDIHKNGTTIFTTQANRPTVAFNDANGWAVATPDITSFVAGDVLTFDIDQAATGAADAVCVGGAVGGGGGGGTPYSLTVGAVTNVNNIQGLTVTDDGGGQVTVAATSDYICVRDEKANGTDGGSFSANTWTKRDINTESSDTGNHCSIASNQITLAAGTYECHILAPGWAVGRMRVRLYNTTDASVTLVGQTNAAYPNTGTALLVGRFTIAASKTFEVQHICEITQATYGLGLNIGSVVSNDNEVEVYTIAEFWRVG